MTLFYIAVAVLLLYGGSHYLVTGIERFSKSTNISLYAATTLLMAASTSFPELITSLLATQRSYNDLAIANIIGSNSSNLLFIGAIWILLENFSSSLKITPKIFTSSLFLLFCTAVVSIFLCSGYFSISLSAVLFLIYLYYSLKQTSSDQSDKKNSVTTDDSPIKEKKWRLPFLFIFSSIALAAGSHLLIENSRQLALSTGLSMRWVGLFIVSLGTSAPELITMIIAFMRKQREIVLGNLLGSNIFNFLVILPLVKFFKPNSPLNYHDMPLDLMVVTLGTLIFIIALKLKRVGQTFLALTMIMSYGVYLLYS